MSLRVALLPTNVVSAANVISDEVLKKCQS